MNDEDMLSSRGDWTDSRLSRSLKDAPVGPIVRASRNAAACLSSLPLDGNAIIGDEMEGFGRLRVVRIMSAQTPSPVSGRRRPKPVAAGMLCIAREGATMRVVIPADRRASYAIFEGDMDEAAFLKNARKNGDGEMHSMMTLDQTISVAETEDFSMVFSVMHGSREIDRLTEM